MEMEVRRELEGSTLSVLPDTAEESPQYQYRMLKDNTIPGLLKCNYHYVDGRLRLVYDITGLKSLPEFQGGRDIAADDLYWIFKTLLETFEQVGRFLLNEEDLIVVPDYVYLDPSKKCTALCCVPGKGGNIFRELHSFTEYFLKRASHNDREGVMLIYELYRLTGQEQYDLEELKKALEQEKEKESEPFVSEELADGVEWMEEDEEYIDLPEEKNTADKKHSSLKNAAYKKGGVAVTVLLTAAAILWLVKAGAFYGENGLRLGAGFLVASAVTAYIIVRGRKETEEGSGDCFDFSDGKEFTDDKEPAGKKRGRHKRREQKKQKAPESCVQETVVLYAGSSTPDSRTFGWLRGKGRQDICISHTPFVIGKQTSGVDECISAETVSRNHARFVRKSDGYYLTDLNSTNGTRINGKKLKPGEAVRVNEYDRITFADKEFEFYIR